MRNVAAVCFVAVFIVSGLVFSRPFAAHPISTPTFVVQQGLSLRTVLHLGEDLGIIRYPIIAELWARLSGNTNIKAGTYVLPQEASDMDILQRLVLGKVSTTPITLLEGWTIDDYAGAFAKQRIVGHQDIHVVSEDAELLAEYRIPASSAEGYLFPDTYRFAPGVASEVVLRTLLDAFFAKLPRDYATRAKGVNLSVHEAVILASIIQKETFLPDEMPLVSGVFHNRLKRNMRLQADPTAIYNMPDYDGNLTKKHLRTMTPYNTYMIRGLPAGPIANPGLDALLAAVAPAETPALYFVANKDGRHVFANSYAEHQRNVRKYQLSR